MTARSARSFTRDAEGQHWESRIRQADVDRRLFSTVLRLLNTERREEPSVSMPYY
jgi:hypothetical protein